MAARGIRGAITASGNEREAIVAATSRLLREIIERNAVRVEDIGAIFFTTTPDLTAEFPAAAARELGWHDVPLLCGHEMSVPGRLDKCVRVMMLVNVDVAQAAIRHVYLDGARSLRPDLEGAQQREGSTTVR
ncbi:MAG TPA: chorismate mutase [Candidatus Eremiobacteraceae bacterium]|nr:chorismate mutase [Candidatus Eremiobacteraceae bacterium]